VALRIVGCTRSSFEKVGDPCSVELAETNGLCFSDERALKHVFEVRIANW